MAKLFVKNFKEGLLGKLTKSIRNKKISQKYGFVVLNWLLTIIAAPLPIFQYANFWKMCENCAHRKINDKLLLDSGLCLKIHQWVIPSNQEKEIFFYLLWRYSSNKVQQVNFYVVLGVVLFDVTQNLRRFQTFLAWCKELSNDTLPNVKYCVFCAAAGGFSAAVIGSIFGYRYILFGHRKYLRPDYQPISFSYSKLINYPWHHQALNNYYKVQLAL